MEKDSSTEGQKRSNPDVEGEREDVGTFEEEADAAIEHMGEQILRCKDWLTKAQARIDDLDLASKTLGSRIVELHDRACEEDLENFARSEEARSRGKSRSEHVPSTSGAKANSVVNLAEIAREKRNMSDQLDKVQALLDRLNKATATMQMFRGHKAEEDEDWSSFLEKDDGAGEMLALLNPNARTKDALRAYNDQSGDEEGEPPGETISYVNYRGDAQQGVATTFKCKQSKNASSAILNFQIEFDEEEESEPLFLALPAGANEVHQAMTASLEFQSGDGRVEVTVVVDSGAAYCAMRSSYLRENFPHESALLTPCSKRFHDASGRPMRVRGSTNLIFWVGECELSAEVYSFDNLSTDMLLGTNAIASNGLVIDAHHSTLAQHPELACGKKCKVPLRCTRRKTATMNFCECSGNHGCQDCEESEPLLVANEEQSSAVACRRATFSVADTRSSWNTVVRVERDTTIEPGQTKGLLLAFDEHAAKEHSELAIVPTAAFRNQYSSCTMLDCTLHSAYNYHAFVTVRNNGEQTVSFGAGQEVADVTLETERWLNPGAQRSVSDSIHFVRDVSVPFEEGGPPTTREHMKSLGLDLTKSIDASRPKEGGGYELLTDEQQNQLLDAALRWNWAWARDAKTPETSRLVVIDIPTGDAVPISQKPYPIPYAYRDAVIKELRKLLDGGLIQPSTSQWACPILVRLKKDSTYDHKTGEGEIALKIICDFRRLNQVTIPDAASIGDQDEILDGCGGQQRHKGIADAAGGFYQFPIAAKDRHKTAFVLPTSMGGSLFEWRVAPYGLTRNPAGYSRGMMFALQQLDKVALAPMGASTGGCSSWIDDITMHADTFTGFVDLFERVLARIATSSMQLKATKTFIMHEKLEVLGYYLTPDGIVMQGSKLKDLENLDADGRPTPPKTVEEIRTFLGAVQFYRRFVPRISLLAAPMVELLRSKPDPKKTGPNPWEGVRQSFEAILTFLKSDAVVSAPDLADPRAEYVICPDACDIAAGGVLLQWQHSAPGGGPGPPAGTPLRGGGRSGADPINQSWRYDAGWKLRTIAYYSKTFDSAQKNYPTFDKEGAAILFCVRRWAKIITGRPTTVYTDSAVASSMLHKHLGPPRLQRWGMELGTFLPYIKIQYRAGAQNGMADFLSRYPTFKAYIKTEQQVQTMPTELFDKLPQAVPLFTHKLGDDEQWLTHASYDLYEAKSPQLVESFWQSMIEANAPVDVNSVKAMGCQAMLNEVAVEPHPNPMSDIHDRLTDMLAEPRPEHDMISLLAATRVACQQEDFWKSQRDFEKYCGQWERYCSTFEITHGRAPVLYDVCCGEGGFSRGARVSGIKCYGFDRKEACRERYENDYSPSGSMKSGMEFICIDASTAEFWEELTRRGRIGDLPPPDLVHVSPPCRGFTRLAQTGGPDGNRPEVDIDVNWIIRRLKRLELARQEAGGQLVWQVENVPESEPNVSEGVTSKARLCGSMFGNRVFRHRVFYCGYEARVDMPHDHKGMWVGSRGVHYSTEDDFKRFGHLPPPNMYGVYSRPSVSRGSLSEWHGAMGFALDTFTVGGIVGALPVSYGRLLAPQMVAHYLSRGHGCPVVPPEYCDSVLQGMVDQWSCSGYGAAVTAEDPTAPTVGGPKLDVDTVATLPCSFDGIDSTMISPLMTSDDLVQPGSEIGEPEFKDYEVTAADQRLQPEFNIVLDKMLSTSTAQHVRAQLERVWSCKEGKLWRWGVSAEGEAVAKLAVPDCRRGALLRRFHHICHRGHKPLEDEISTSYWWPTLAADCLTFTDACTVCNQTRSRNLVKAPVVPVPTPSRPFEVIHVDHKGPLPRSGKFVHVLVVVCALTRFTLYIPVSTVTAEETLRSLMARVFCVFGYPLVIVSDNGPAFRNELMHRMAGYFGYRHTYILPYNAPANGIAEASVKRLKILLDRHCKGYKEWHKILPLAQMQLNAHTHTGTKMSPYMALFGRSPTKLEFLENPSLLPNRTTGSEWLDEIRVRMVRIHSELQRASDDIKKARAAEANARQRSELNHRAGHIQPGGWIRILRDSNEKAAYIRKHGHGEPWKNKYKVLEVKPHGVRLEVPKDGSVPAISEWQLIRRCEPARADDILPEKTDPQLTEAGVPLPQHNVRVPDTTPDTTVYEIDKVLRAEKIGNRYKLWIKWKGYIDPSAEWKSDIEKQTSNEELLKEIEDAVQRYKDEQGGREPEDDPVVEDELIEQREPEGGDAEQPEQAANDAHGPRRPTRRRATVDRYEPIWYLPQGELPLLALRTPTAFDTSLNNLAKSFRRNFGL